MSSVMFTVAVYELNQEYGGAEEGGWWYTAGNLQYVSRVFEDKAKAYAHASRMNRTYEWMVRGVGKKYWSAIYSGGHYDARVCEGEAPAYFPESRPYYE